MGSEKRDMALQKGLMQSCRGYGFFFLYMRSSERVPSGSMESLIKKHRWILQSLDWRMRYPARFDLSAERQMIFANNVSMTASAINFRVCGQWKQTVWNLCSGQKICSYLSFSYLRIRIRILLIVKGEEARTYFTDEYKVPQKSIRHDETWASDDDFFVLKTDLTMLLDVSFLLRFIKMVIG